MPSNFDKEQQSQVVGGESAEALKHAIHYQEAFAKTIKAKEEELAKEQGFLLQIEAKLEKLGGIISSEQLELLQKAEEKCHLHINELEANIESSTEDYKALSAAIDLAHRTGKPFIPPNHVVNEKPSAFKQNAVAPIISAYAKLEYLERIPKDNPSIDALVFDSTFPKNIKSTADKEKALGKIFVEFGEVVKITSNKTVHYTVCLKAWKDPKKRDEVIARGAVQSRHRFSFAELDGSKESGFINYNAKPLKINKPAPSASTPRIS